MDDASQPLFGGLDPGPDIQVPEPHADDAARRAEELRKAAELGKKRMEHERAIREGIRERKEREAKKGEQMMREALEKQQQTKEQKQEFRRLLKVKERERERERLQKEKEEQARKAEKEAAEKERKKKLQYMEDIRATAAMKQAAENRKNALKQEKARELQKVEFDHRQRVDGIHLHTQTALTDLERESRVKKTLIETEGHEKIFRLESVRRMQLAALESDVRSRQSSIRARSALDAQRERENIEVLARNKRRKIESDFKDQKESIENETRARLLAYEGDVRDMRAILERDSTDALLRADHDQRMRTDELNRRYDDLLLGKKRK